MSVSITSKKDAVTKKGGNWVNAIIPNVCKTPGQPGSLIPIPYPNSAPPVRAASPTKVITSGTEALLKSSSFFGSTGDEAGTAFKTQTDAELTQRLQVAGFSPAAARTLAEGGEVES